MKKGSFFCIVLIAFLVFAGTLAEAADWRFPLGLTYLGGINDVKNLYDDNVKAKYAVLEDENFGYALPVGITFNPYVQFENGLGAGLGIGPIAYILYYVETRTSTRTDDETFSFTNFPVSLDFRYIFMPESNTSPYVRAGGRYNITSGDFVESSSAGIFGGAGIEFGRTKKVGGGIEVTYDTSRVEFEKLERQGSQLISEKEKIKPGALMVSAFVVF
jgi:hypothetical protein